MSGRDDERFDREVAFARMTGERFVRVWMRWQGWQMHIGCDRCAGDGPAAPCWGLAECHGYEHGCGCSSCAALQAAQEAEARPLVGTLGAELAELGERIGSRTGGCG